MKEKIKKISIFIQELLFPITKKVPDISFRVPNPYNLPVHNQGNKNNCTSHAFASVAEDYLSNKLKERVLIDVDDLWEKQKKFGTATEERGDFLDGPIIIARKYGVRFSTKKGRHGTFFLSDKTEKQGGITSLFVDKIEFVYYDLIRK